MNIRDTKNEFICRDGSVCNSISIKVITRRCIAVTIACYITSKAIIVINTWYNRDYLASTDALVRKCPFLQRLIDANAGGCLQASECAWLSAISAVVPYLPLHRVSISLINWLTDWDTEQVRRISTQCFFKFRVLKSLNGTRKTIFHFL